MKTRFKFSSERLEKRGIEPTISRLQGDYKASSFTTTQRRRLPKHLCEKLFLDSWHSVIGGGIFYRWQVLMLYFLLYLYVLQVVIFYPKSNIFKSSIKHSFTIVSTIVLFCQPIHFWIGEQGDRGYKLLCDELQVSKWIAQGFEKRKVATNFLLLTIRSWLTLYLQTDIIIQKPFQSDCIIWMIEWLRCVCSSSNVRRSNYNKSLWNKVQLLEVWLKINIYIYFTIVLSLTRLSLVPRNILRAS